ncbi:MAG: transcription termination factor Rho [Gemmatimonadetes bacterium]|nr:transcription termination factor Rho [Gemmatimonadota bacterium]
MRLSDNGPLGLLEIVDRRAGFIRRRENSYLANPGDIHVGQSLIQRFGLRTGDQIAGAVDGRAQRGRSPSLGRITELNGKPPQDLLRRPEFNRLSAIHPDTRLVLECGRMLRDQPDPTNRIVDLLCPFGKGQRALIVSPSKAGKTTVLQAIAEGVSKNYPEAVLLILLVDERPEEVTEMQDCGFGEVIASSFDFPPDRHAAVAEITLERARRRVESGDDVVLILDSITRLARAYNSTERSSGRTLSGGLDSNAMERPKRFFGSARAVDPGQGGGSMTIISTALVDTGSQMDQVIFEEFKGTGNSELVLSRELAERRMYPAIDISASATRREELLLPPDELAASRALRRKLAGRDPAVAMEQLLSILRGSPSNAALVKAMTERS